MNTIRYRGVPIIRSGNTIYHGNLEDYIIAKIEVLTTCTRKSVEVASKLEVSLIRLSQSGEETILKSTIKSSLIDSLDLSQVWINHELSK